jgi:tetratricopeptide (TPR) repeat protein
MSLNSCSARLIESFSHITLMAAVAVLLQTAAAFGEGPSCEKVAAHAPTPAQSAYIAAKYAQAEDLYRNALTANPGDLQLAAGLVSTLLQEHEVTRAAGEVDKMLAASPASAIALTSKAELQVHQGQPWLALETLKKAATIDTCYPRTHLVRARVLRLDSMYASERAEIQSAYAIDPSDPDIRHAYLSTVLPANEIESIHQSLATTKDLDTETRQKAEESIRSMMTLLTENNQTCQILPTADSATFALEALHEDAKHIDGYRLEVEFPKSNAKLLIDTAGSGLFISRAQSVQNGFEPSAGAPPGTVHVDSVRIGPLEFRDCIVGVSDTPFSNKGDGLIGTDMFAQWLIKLDHPGAKLTLTPLPKLDGILPGDRIADPALQGFMPVYHRQQHLLVPVTLDNKTRKLFILDSGIRFSTMTPEAAHAVSNIKMNFTNPVQTVTGATLQVYRDNFDFQFANLSLPHQSHILEMDTTAIEENSGIQVAGMLGFDMLHTLVLNLDYRDGLVKLDSPAGSSFPSAGKTGPTAVASDEPDCGPEDERARPLSSTIEAKVTGLLDSGHLKPGKEIYVRVVNDWRYPGCDLEAGSLLYGRVISASSLKSPELSELSLKFDRGQCAALAQKEFTLQVIGLIAPPDQFIGQHSVMPAEVAGRGRNISTSAGEMGEFAQDQNLNPGGAPHTVHPGIVAGIPTMKMEPRGGPACSTKFTSTEGGVRLGVGSELLLAMEAVH